MPNTRMTKQKWVNHWRYNKFQYLLIIAVCVLCGDLLYQVTAYRAPNERKVDFQLVAEYSDADFFTPYAEVALKAGQAFDDTLEEVNFYSLMYSGGSDDVYGAQKYMVMIGANEGHVYFVNHELMEQLVLQGAALPLNDLIDAGHLKTTPEMDLSKVTYTVKDDEALSALGDKVYAMPIGELYGAMTDDVHYDVRGKYAVIMIYVPNPETTAVVLQSVIDQLTAPAPEWVLESAN